MATHPRAQPNFRNLFIKPFWMTLVTALRTLGRPIFGWGYHNKSEEMLDEHSKNRVSGSVMNDVSSHDYAADREGSDLYPNLWKPMTLMYPYERLEDLEPWLFVPGQYNGRIGVIWETCTACKLCVKICPNDCLHMSTELRVDILDGAEGENAGYGSNLEVGGWAAVEVSGAKEFQETRNPVTSHDAPIDEFRFGEVIDLSGDTATVRWNDTGGEDIVERGELLKADDQIISGRIDIGRCMFCGLCMEACHFTSFFMTNEYDGMSGFTRQELWFDAARTRVLIGEHQEVVDAELAKRATKERVKREKKAAKVKAEA